MNRSTSKAPARRPGPTLTETRATADAKIARPRLRGIVARERLFERIDAPEAPVIWVSGPPGAGKTTLAASYVEMRKLPHLWYQVDALDSDPATFFFYLRRAVAESEYSRREPLPLLPVESTANLSVFTRHFVHELLDRLPRSTVLVIDNYQEANDALHSLLRVLCEQLPDDFRLIVLSLEDPPVAFARLVANRKIALLDPEELRFTRDEAGQVVGLRLDAGEESISVLHEQSRGWAAGLVLMSEHARRSRKAGGIGTVMAQSQLAVFDYFADVVLSFASAEDQRLLLLTAALPRVTAKLAAAISGHPDPARVLEYLHRRRLFTNRRQTSEVVYEYHGLFRDFLRARAEALLPRAEHHAAAQRAALQLEASGQFEDAIAMFVAAQDWDSATRLIMSLAQELYEQGRWRTLVEWIEAVPESVRDAAPGLAFWLGACRVWVSPAEARLHLEQAFRGFAAARDRSGQILAVGALTRACILAADWSALDRWIDAFEPLVGPGVEALCERTRLIGFSRLLYAAFVRQPRHPRLAAWAEQALATLSSTEVDVNENVMAAVSLMTYYQWTGATSTQEHIARRVKTLLASPQLRPASLAYWKWAYSNYVLRVGAPREALALIDSAIEHARESGLAIEAVIRRYRIGHLLTLGELRTAERDIRALDHAPHVEPYYEMRSWLALQRGDTALAEQEARKALQLATDRGRVFYQILDLLLLAAVYAEAGDCAGAMVYLDEYRCSTSGVDGPLHAYQSSLVHAYVALQSGAPEQCHALLRAALNTGQRFGFRSHWYWSARMMARLYAEALDHGIAVDYVRDVIREQALQPASPDVENWPWPVKIYCLGRFEILRDDQPIRFEGKAQRKPLELAKALVALGGRDIRVEQLIDILWPDPAKSDGQKAFEITVHRLREMLGAASAVLVTDRRASLNPHIVWVDAIALDRRLGQLLPAGDGIESDVDQVQAAAATVMSLYQGHFLATDADEAWQIPLRNRLAGRFSRFVLRLGGTLESRQQWARAQALYGRAVELDPLAETFYRRQMACLLAQGLRAEGIDVFRRCRQTLSIVLGVTPAQETEALYRQLRVNQQPGGIADS